MRVRADAVRNSERVLEAAREVFAERGLSAGVDEVAARAGVGKATVYRCWPTKELLVAAVAGARVDAFTERVLDALADPDPTGAFRELLLSAAETSAANRLLHTGLSASRETPELAAKRAACALAMQRLMDRGQQQGGIRRDATAADVTVLFNGFVAMLTAAGESDPAVWRRYADLVVAALRP
ncbi:MAG: TetR/AcrR family transcriptional regulator [Mycobacteriales bacterium]